MTSTDFDLVIIGGGIPGVGVAQAAGASGYSSLLLESHELGWATSSRSSKLIHGGLRYLETLQLGLVRESLRERHILLTIAPSLVRWVPFYLPIYRNTSRSTWKVRAGLSLYAILGGLSPHSRFQCLKEKQWPRGDGLDTHDLRTVFRYWDAQTNDRLMTEAVMESAISLGAKLECPARFLSAERDGDHYQVRYESGSGELTCTSRAVVNATGPWVTRVLKNISPEPASLEVELVAGTHILIEGELHEGIYYTESPRDQRPVFIMPWEGNTLVVTTETRYQGDPAQVEPNQEEIDYLLDTYRCHFPERGAEILDSYAGLRVLPKGPGGPQGRSRETLLLPDNPDDPRLISVAGGKYTGYRATAQKVLQELRRALPEPRRIADTADLPLTIPKNPRTPRPQPQ